MTEEHGNSHYDDPDHDADGAEHIGGLPRQLHIGRQRVVRLGVTQRWVRRAVAERRISFVKVGRNVRFEPEAITRYIERQRKAARDDAA